MKVTGKLTTTTHERKEEKASDMPGFKDKNGKTVV